MSPADRIRDWIDSLSLAWKDRLRGWMASWVVGGLTEALEDMTPEQKASLDAVSKRIIDNPDIATDLKDMLKAAGGKGNPIETFVKNVILGYWLIDIVRHMVAPEGTKLGYAAQREFKPYRLDPLSIITAWRRDPEKYAKYFADLKDQGWDDERIEALKFFTLFYPSPQDLITWQAREVFEPKMIERYGLMAEVGELRREDFYKAGMTDEQINNYWMAHWEHPEFRSVVEMLRRTDFTEEDMYDWFRLVEIPPYWRDKLIQISYAVPTRVDVRRFWDMRTIDEARLREIYAWQGYHGKDLDDYVLWTKVYVAFPDLLARWENGWITIDTVRSELTSLGMPADRVEEMIETKIKPTEPERVSEEMDLTKAEICAGVKKGVISRDEGIELLEDIGKSREEAEFILDVKVGAAIGSPETYPEFKEWTQRFRKAAGMPAKIPTEELKRAATEVVRLTKDVAALKEAVETEQRGLVAGEILPESATKKLSELKVALHRAEAELSAAKTNYNVLVAQWRHGA